ncbi:MAG TPA: alpha-2-macroglobulin, partial [Planctomycetaceae bacterium]|nr:alpha-2-macroglobulin [Planctomycetaceae bacterium]
DRELSDDLKNAVDCLKRVNRVKEFDALIEDAVEAHGDNWRLLHRSAELLTRHGVPNMGFLVAGDFERGYRRGGGKQVSSSARDRVRALQLLVRTVELMEKDKSASGKEKATTYRLQADIIGQVQMEGAWKLQDLTDIDELPDYDEAGGFGGGRGLFSIPTQFGRGFLMGSDNGAPVDADGRPVFHQMPESWAAAKTDGERWRWCLEMVARSDKGRRSEVDLEWASFLQSQFGVSSASAGPVPVVRDEDADNRDAFAGNGLIPVHKLKDTETMARLATGIRRFDLPEEFNHIAILRKVVKRNDGQKRQALESLVTVRMNRHQYPQAAKVLEDVVEVAAVGNDRDNVQKRIDQIRKNWIQFQNVSVQPAGTEATLDVRYRNGERVSFSARPVKIEALLQATKDYLQSSPARVDYQVTQVENVGMQIIRSNEQKYLGKVAESWNLKLEPPEDHFDALKTVTTPLKTAGAWYVTAKIKGGNEARMVIWIADTAITRKRTEAGTLHYVADAVTGNPVAKADLEFFGWRSERVARTRNYKVLTSRFAERTDEDGICVPATTQLDRTYRWLTIARTAEGRLAYDGFNNVWNPQKIQPFRFNSNRIYSITDRPVYRPGHDVKFRMWVRSPKYTTEDAAHANRSYALQIRNPKGDIVLDRDVRTDRWAGVDGEWTIPADATLGRYSIAIGTRTTVQRQRTVNGEKQTYTEKRLRQIGSGSFKVEEYRKPEYEVVIDAPEKPVMLGEKIQAKVEAKYYFGAPVTEAKVHYKVERTAKDTRWYPIATWDWLYAPGYWWFAPDYEWYPGWQRWGCFGPIPPWRGWRADPPEIIAEGDAEIGPDGKFLI